MLRRNKLNIDFLKSNKLKSDFLLLGYDQPHNRLLSYRLSKFKNKICLQNISNYNPIFKFFKYNILFDLNNFKFFHVSFLLFASVYI